jgi:hypothetical protein
MFTILMLGSGLLWTITYLLIIFRSARDQTYGMPMVALCANLSWEAIFSFVYPPHLIKHVVNLIWFSLDVVIFLQLLRAGPHEFADIPKRVFYSAVAVLLATCFCSVLLITVEFHDQGTYSAFGQNLLMSALFIAMLYRRRGLRGQSLFIALCKGGGTLLASVAFWLYVPLSLHSVLLPFLYGAIAVYDVLYIGLVYHHERARASVSQEPVAARPKAAKPL